ncbi:hypothetical protein ACKXGD_17080, partial [Enterococcus lactis]|uniref:hypothetical protein n=1 Tax=Enterococcus lactis TaxID=357441 RepID=UPI003907F7DC
AEVAYMDHGAEKVYLIYFGKLQTSPHIVRNHWNAPFLPLINQFLQMGKLLIKQNGKNLGANSLGAQ